MRKKDYELIARSIAKSMLEIDDLKKESAVNAMSLSGSSDVFKSVIGFLVKDLWFENNKFDGDKFYKLINKQISELPAIHTKGVCGN